MTKPAALKIAIGLALGVAIGAVRRIFSIPSPAPQVIAGALLVLSMTIGWIVTDRYFARGPKRNAGLCGGPTGENLQKTDASQRKNGHD
jgi:XapX domain-containing protein